MRDDDSSLAALAQNGSSGAGEGGAGGGGGEGGAVGGVALEEMTSKDYYFDSYAHFGIHEV